MNEYTDPPPPELCLGCGDEAEFAWSPGTSDRHICPHRDVVSRPGNQGSELGSETT